jgi:hypothetical protein
MTTLYHIQSPLASFPAIKKSILATFSDQQLEHYREEYDRYLTAQRAAVADGSVKCDELRKLVRELFGGTNSKQYKYFERMIKNGELVIDKHSQLYSRPEKVTKAVQEAREEYSSAHSTRITMGADDSTLEEMNNAVAFLLNNGYVLNTDFTVANAVTVAQRHVRQNIDTSDEWNHMEYTLRNSMQKSEAFQGFKVKRASSYYGEYEFMVEGHPAINVHKYNVSFAKSSTPTVVIS